MDSNETLIKDNGHSHNDVGLNLDDNTNRTDTNSDSNSQNDNDDNSISSHYYTDDDDTDYDDADYYDADYDDADDDYITKNRTIYREKCQCQSLKKGTVNRERFEKQGRIILPNSFIKMLEKHEEYPIILKVTNENKNKKTYCSFLEISDEIDLTYLPKWMMRNLSLEEDNECQIELVSLPVGTYAKFQPKSKDFLDIPNIKLVLESILIKFPCLSVGDIIPITYNKKVYDLIVKETKPENAISIVDCDLPVDFDSTVDYQSETTNDDSDTEIEIAYETEFLPFNCIGYRINGEMVNTEPITNQNKLKNKRRGYPNFRHNPYSVKFFRNFAKNTVVD